MKAVVLQSNYVPWKGYFDLIHDADVFVFYDEVKYTKNDWRNRNLIYSKNGLQWLTIPISKEAVKLKISDVVIDDNEWQALHFASLYHAYKAAPHFSQLEMFMHDFYRENTWTHISKLNQYSIKKISEFLGITTRFLNSSQFDLKTERFERLLGLLQQVGATTYISGPSAKDYLAGSLGQFRQNNIEVVYKNYDNYPEYKQLRRPFENFVSIFDLIANIYKDDIRQYIWGWRKD
jgi:hypothetical protein